MLKKSGVALLFATIASVALLGAGSVSAQEISPEGRTVITFVNGNEGNLGPEEMMQEYVDEYNASQDEVYVDYQYMLYSGVGDYYEKLAINIASGDPWDIFSMSPAQRNKYINEGIAMCVDDVLLENDDLIDSARDSIIAPDGHVYTYPVGQDVIGIYVNTDMLEEAGHTLDDLKTWDGVVKAAEDIAATCDVYGFLLPLVPDGYQQCIWYSNMWNCGADILEDLEGNVTVVNPEGVARAAMQFRDVINGPGGSTEFDSALDNFYNGICGMLIRSTSGLRRLDGQDPDNDPPTFGTAFIPIPSEDENSQNYCSLGGWQIMINGATDHAQEAKKFVDWLYFDTDYLAQKCLTRWNLCPRKSLDEAMAPLYMETTYNVAYNLINSGEMVGKGEKAFDSELLEDIGDLLNAVIYETSTDEEAMECVQAFIETTGATVVEE